MALNRPPSTVREQTGDPALDRIQKQRDDIARMLALCPFLQGRLISCRFLAGGTFYVFTHRLGTRAAVMLANFNYDPLFGGPGFAQDVNYPGIDHNNQIALAATTGCDVDLWFYPRASRPISLTTRQSP